MAMFGRLAGLGQQAGLALHPQQQAMNSLIRELYAGATSRSPANSGFIGQPLTVAKKPSSFKEELQNDVDKWLADVKL